jgi:hypothetical protein
VRRGITFLEDEVNFVRQIITGAFLPADGHEHRDVDHSQHPGPGIVTPSPDGRGDDQGTRTVGSLRSLRDPHRQAGRTVFIGTFDLGLGVFRVDIESQAGHRFDLCEAVS